MLLAAAVTEVGSGGRSQCRWEELIAMGGVDGGGRGRRRERSSEEVDGGRWWLKLNKVRRRRLSVFVLLSPPWVWGPRSRAQDPKVIPRLGGSLDASPVSEQFLGDTETLGSRAALCETKSGIGINTAYCKSSEWKSETISRP